MNAVPRDHQRPGEIAECTALGHALLFDGPRQRRMVALLRERGFPAPPVEVVAFEYGLRPAESH